jgi:hypothetical protein
MNDLFNVPHSDVEVILADIPEPYTAVAFTLSRISFPALK